MKTNTLFLSIIITSLFLIEIHAQDFLSGTRVSQRAEVTQRIGSTDITVVYHSPLAGGREVFGKVVPFDFVVEGVEYPWRAGANENTTVAFTHDVTIEGKELPKGTYGLHILVGEGEWTWIFSRNASSWGSFSYKKEEDALRVTGIPQKTDHQEWLSYEFTDLKPDSASLQLSWAGVGCGIRISTDVSANVLADLAAKEEKTVNDYLVMANRSLSRNPPDIETALAYVDTSLILEKNFSNTMLKSMVLEKAGRPEESEAWKKDALAMGAGFPYYYYYPLSYLNTPQGTATAQSLLSEMESDEPDNYIVQLALGEFYLRTGNQKRATEHFKKAYEHVREEAKPYARYMYLVNAARVR